MRVISEASLFDVLIDNKRSESL